MKARAFVMATTVLAVLGWLAAGCATRPETDWASRVGTFTFEDATREMGEPDRVVGFPDGGREADWLLRRGTPGTGTHAVWRLGDISTAGSFLSTGSGGPDWKRGTPPTPDRVLRLTFAPDGRLAAWEKTERLP